MGEAFPRVTCCAKRLYVVGGYECPDNMVCMKLDMSAHVEGFYGMFNDFGMLLQFLHSTEAHFQY